MHKIKKILNNLYDQDAEKIYKELKTLLKEYEKNPIISEKRKKYENKIKFSNKDSILITYADSIFKKNEKPLKTLNCFLKKYIKNRVTGVHILPFFPSSSDNGYSVVDFKKVRPDLGNWNDIHEIGKKYRLMADLVFNHISKESYWFQEFLKGNEKYENYFISFNEKIDTSNVFRPREHPLLTKFKTEKGEKYLWTTFSADQIDLNFKEPEVLLEMIKIMLFYLSNHIEIIRLDAIGFAWKEKGTNCLHLPQVYEIIKLFRNILNQVAPYATIITETNVSYEENISYFANNNKAHLVYQFSLPPLVLDAFLKKDSTCLKVLIKKNNLLNPKKTFLNFLASHDGIGIIGAKNFLKEEEIKNLLEEIKKRNGYISSRSVVNKKQPYEMNINYFSALEESVEKFITSQAIMVFLRGLPGIYIHSLLGSKNWNKGVEKSGIKRDINREKLNYDQLERELKIDPRKIIFKKYLKLLKIRQSFLEFSPLAKEKIINSNKNLLILKKEEIFLIFNLSENKIPLKEYKGKLDLISNKEFKGTIEPLKTYCLK